jgi:F0F1-type ATP synthase assembly protein I
MREHVNLDVQPEPDLSASETAAASMGLVLSSSLIIGTGVGAMVGHALLDNAFGLGQDVLLGAIVGALLLGSLGVAIVTAITAWFARREV